VLSLDTNILLYAYDSQCKEHLAALDFVRAQATNPDFAICELVLVELYVLLRNPAVVAHPLSAKDAVEVVQAYRVNRNWAVIECADGVMHEVWRLARAYDFGRRQVFDSRLALTLRRHGVRAFATRNVTHFDGFGFDRVWDPLA